LRIEATGRHDLRSFGWRLFMIRSVGRAQLIGIAAILAFFFLTEFAIQGVDAPRVDQAQATSRR
jgi:hypothetical protein